MQVLGDVYEGAADRVAIGSWTGCFQMAIGQQNKRCRVGKRTVGLREEFEDSIPLRLQRLRGAIDCVQHDDDFGGVIHRLAVDGVECGELAGLLVVEDGEVLRGEVGDRLASVVGYLDVERDAMAGLKFAFALLLCAGLQRRILGGDELGGEGKDDQARCGGVPANSEMLRPAVEPHAPTITRTAAEFLG